MLEARNTMQTTGPLHGGFNAPGQPLLVAIHVIT